VIHNAVDNEIVEEIHDEGSEEKYLWEPLGLAGDTRMVVEALEVPLLVYAAVVADHSLQVGISFFRFSD
jgi:hypothetical protein